ncbi:MAG: AEC family transporter [Pseudomonadota bacterium]
MTDITQALLPVFLVILFGYALRRIEFPGDEFWPHVERLVYFVLFPVLLFGKLASAPLEQLSTAPMIVVLLVSIFVIATLTLLLRPWLKIDGPVFSSLFQGNVRFNSYVAIAIAIMLDPTTGLTLAAIAVITMVPLLNVLCVVVLAFHASREQPDWRSIASALLRNPLIIGCFAGISVNLLAVPLPQTVWRLADILGAGALPLGLLAVGAALRFEQIQDNRMIILLSVAIKLLVFPAVAWCMCILLEVDLHTRSMILLFTALPTAGSAYVLARQMGGAHTLMASIITLQTLISVITVPIILAFSTWAGS